ncbi:branched-chain amino acid permease [Clostridium sp. OM02-18AC]|uniref:branched-chain amino acid transporter permease n=1 Tax=Clostridium sp. OM02-18AC TaxID=2292311 RepID=UPI000E4943D0|nr:AzlD domain-containing protein [Clostridium sp. OM02-18AC]RHV66453.1 branched-chain amino acid permease [Clostridium sp. OM02-18AC]
MRSFHMLLSILIPALLTFGLRALPFLLLNKRELPKRIEYLGNVFPMAIMATLVVYCLKSVPESALQDNLILLAGVLVTAVIHIWKKSSILSITVGTVVYMVLVHFV